MSRQLIRVSLAIIALSIIIAFFYQAFLSEQQIASERETARSFSVTAWNFEIELGDLRSAQQAYVAAGQDRAYWVEKVALHYVRIATDLEQLLDLSVTQGAVNALAESKSLVENLKQINELALDHSASGQDLLASDLIFTDGLELMTNAARQLDIARTSEQNSHELVRQDLRRNQEIMLISALGTSLISIILLVPTERRKLVKLDGTVTESAVVSTTVSNDLILKSEDSTPITEVDSPADLFKFGEASRNTKTNLPNLERAADLCTDLGRLIDTKDLPDVLSRAAELLHAVGIIIWVRDEGGEMLRPAAWHGYSQSDLNQIGKIRCDGDNVTVEAYRAAKLQIVHGITDKPGAIAAPLLSPNGCIGVISAELRKECEIDELIQATTKILAAQLSTLITADQPPEAKMAQG
jgi:hypothetical protein